jgi:hypothetical protein
MIKKDRAFLETDFGFGAEAPLPFTKGVKPAKGVRGNHGTVAEKKARAKSLANRKTDFVAGAGDSEKEEYALTSTLDILGFTEEDVSEYKVTIGNSLEDFNKHVRAKDNTEAHRKVLGDITYGEVENAIWVSGGAITTVAKKLNISTTYVRNIFDKYRSLGQLFSEFRESLLDEVESHLMKKIRSGEKGDTVAMIFFLKCHGRDRGWLDHETQPRKTSIKMKIVPAKGMIIDAETVEDKPAKKKIEFKSWDSWESTNQECADIENGDSDD